MITFHANQAEVVFFLVSMIVMFISVHALRESMVDQSVLDQKAADTAGYEPKRIVADANIRSEWFKISISSVMILASASALFLEPPPPQYTFVPQTLVYTIAWISVAMLMIVSSILDRSARRALLQYGRRVEDKKGRRVTDKMDKIPNGSAVNGVTNGHSETGPTTDRTGQ